MNIHNTKSYSLHLSHIISLIPVRIQKDVKVSQEIWFGAFSLFFLYSSLVICAFLRILLSFLSEDDPIDELLKLDDHKIATVQKVECCCTTHTIQTVKQLSCTVNELLFHLIIIHLINRPSCTSSIRTCRH